MELMLTYESFAKIFDVKPYTIRKHIKEIPGGVVPDKRRPVSFNLKKSRYIVLYLKYIMDKTPIVKTAPRRDVCGTTK